MTECVQPRCSTASSARWGPYCSRECARLNALVVTPTAPFPAPGRGGDGRGRREPPTSCPQTLVQCRRCRLDIMVITSPSGVVRVDPDPTEDGNLVINGSQLIAVLAARRRQGDTWAGLAYEEHRCLR